VTTLTFGRLTFATSGTTRHICVDDGVERVVGQSLVDKAGCLGRYLGILVDYGGLLLGWRSAVVDNQQAPVYFHASPSTPSKCGTNYEVHVLSAIRDAMCVIKMRSCQAWGVCLCQS
jgi:hypothetical protein